MEMVQMIHMILMTGEVMVVMVEDDHLAEIIIEGMTEGHLKEIMMAMVVTEDTEEATTIQTQTQVMMALLVQIILTEAEEGEEEEMIM